MSDATPSLDRSKHRHYWNYPHSIWTGRSSNEVVVARYCSCGEIQIARAAEWRKVTRRMPDVREECRKQIDMMRVQAWARSKLR